MVATSIFIKIYDLATDPLAPTHNIQTLGEQIVDFAIEPIDKDDFRLFVAGQ